MLVLAFDTSSSSGSVALVRDGDIVAELSSGLVGTHAEWLMPSIAGLLDSAGAVMDTVDLFAVDTGPGAFTGLRVGAATVKGLAWALGKKVAGVSTLESLALNLRYSAHAVCPVLDARKGEVYAAIYRFNGAWAEPLLKDSVMAPEELYAAARDISAPVVFLGPGLKTYGRAIVENAGPAVLAPEHTWHIKASNVAFLALKDPSAAVSPDLLTPAYLRRFVSGIKSTG